MSTQLPRKQQSVLQKRTVITPVIKVTARYGERSIDLIKVGGSVTIDRRRNQRTTASLSVIVRPGLTEVVTELGTELDISAGVRTIDGAESVVPLATALLVTGIDGDTRVGSVLSVQATDRSERAARYRFERPFPVAAGTDLASVVNLVLNNRGMASTLTPVGVSILADRVFGLEAEKDPWSELCDLTTGFGWRLWIGRNGLPVLDQEPVPSAPYPVLVLNPKMSKSSLPANVIVGRWEPDDAPPVFATVEDTDPASPTFVGGPYGRVTRFFASSLPISQAGADQAVRTILAGQRYQGATWTPTLPFDPTIDPDDVLSGSDIPNLIVDSMTIDFGSGMTIEGREVPS